MAEHSLALLGLLGSTSLLLTACNVPNPLYCAFSGGRDSCENEGDYCILYERNGDFDSFEAMMGELTPEKQRGCFAELPTEPLNPVFRDSRTMSAPTDYCCIENGVTVTNREWADYNAERINCQQLTGLRLDELSCKDEPSGTTTGTTTSGSGTESTSEPTTMGSSSSGDSTTGGSCDPADCTTDAPVCSDGICVPCSDVIPCSAPDGPGGICDGGKCVECTADDEVDEDNCTDPMRPICDAEDRTCRSCNEHFDCGAPQPDGQGCNLFTGACLSGFWGEAGARATLGEVVDAFNASGETEGTIILQSSVEHSEELTFSDGSVVAFVGSDPLDPADWSPPAMGNSPFVTASGGSTILLASIRFQNHNASGYALDFSGMNTRAWIERTRMSSNSGGSIRGQSNALIRIQNSTVVGLTDDPVIFINNAHLDLRFSTLISSDFDPPETRAVECQSPVSSNIANSILIAASPQMDVEPIGVCPVLPANSIELVGAGEIVSEGWFVEYDSAGESFDLHLTLSGTAQFCQPLATALDDPLYDIDYDARSKNDCRGADVPIP